MSQVAAPTEQYVTQLEGLVEELLKESPEEVLIRTKMETLGIQYSEDPVERINRVLCALHPDETLDFE